jgi:hypothetical protein
MPLARVDPDLKPLGDPPGDMAHRDSTFKVVGPECPTSCAPGDARSSPVGIANGTVPDQEARRPLAVLAYDARRDPALRGNDFFHEFRENPSAFSYEELMRFGPKAERAAWHTKAMDTAERADLASLIELWLSTREIERLVKRVRAATDAEIEDLSHYRTEPAATRVAKSYPDVAAKIYRALGMRILNAKKSKYYDAALSHFENARRCYERSDLHREWAAVAADVRRMHHRKAGFMADFERLVAGRGPSDEPSFLERARSRWSARGESASIPEA